MYPSTIIYLQLSIEVTNFTISLSKRCAHFKMRNLKVAVKNYFDAVFCFFLIFLNIEDNFKKDSSREKLSWEKKKP